MTIATVRGIALLAAVAVVFSTGLLMGRAQVGQSFAEYRETQAEDALVDQSFLIAQRDTLSEELAQLGRLHQKEKANAEAAERERLAAVLSGERRLSVLASRCRPVEATGAGSMDDATVRAELEPAHAGRIVGLAIEGDVAIRTLTALQDYVRKVCPGYANYSHLESK